MFPERLESIRYETRQEPTDFRPSRRATSMSAEDLEQYESELELQLYR